MAQEAQGWSIGELAKVLGAEVVGDPATIVNRPVEAVSKDPHGITFAEAPKYFEALKGSGVGCAILPLGSPDLGMPALLVEHPRRAFGVVLGMYYRPIPITPGIAVSASVHPTAYVDPTANIGENVVIAPHARVEKGAQVHAGTYVGENCVVGELTVLMPNVTLVQDVRMGARCLIHSGTVLGADGFGFAFDGSKHQKIPQVGGVIIGDNVEMGANCAVDRATAGDTIVGSGCKFDNYVHIAHNCRVGQHCVIAGIAALGGSVTFGDYVVMGGGSMIKDHCSVAAGTQLGGHTLVTGTIDERGEYWGSHCLPVRKALRTQIIERQLPELVERIKTLEAEVKRLMEDA